MAKSTKATPKELEQKFAETAFRISQERNDFLLPQILDFVRKDKWINLRPEYQRRLVWDTKKRSLFIESLLLNIPIPPLFLYEWELSRYEVMDGQQRLNAVLEFYENGFPLLGLEKWSELNGCLYRDLPETLKRGLDRRRLSATVLLVETMGSQRQRNDIRKLVFERLNTGGQHLNAQELRNCLYAGKFNELIIKLARDKLFASIWQIPDYESNIDAHGHITKELAEDRLYRRMIDCEIVLRYFAFGKKSRIRGSIRSILDNAMMDYANVSDAEISAFESRFLAHLGLAHDIFGPHTFRYQDQKGKWNLSLSLYDAIMIALGRLWDKRQQLKANRVAIVKAVSRLLRNKDAYAVIVGRPNTAKAILGRIELLTTAIDSA